MPTRKKTEVTIRVAWRGDFVWAENTQKFVHSNVKMPHLQVKENTPENLHQDKCRRRSRIFRAFNEQF